MTRGPVLRPAISQLCDPNFQLRLDGYDVYISYVKGPSQFWIQLKEDEQIINDVADELAKHVENKGARRVERPEVGQLYTMESPDYGGYYRVRVGSVDGKMMCATFIDYGDAHRRFWGFPFGNSIYFYSFRISMLQSTFLSRYRLTFFRSHWFVLT